MDQRPLELEMLLAQRGWLRTLAIRLVADENRADDLVQQVWLHALERPPRSEGSVRGWLRAVLRSRWRDQQRSDAARGARERATFEERAVPATAEIAARIEAQQTVARAVLELDEPLRAVVLLHFFEELPLREIARRLGVPYETVRHRLGRALDALRWKLKDAYGEDESQRTALLLVAHGTGGPPSSGAGTVFRIRGASRWIAGCVTALLIASVAAVVVPSRQREVATSRERSAIEMSAGAPAAPTTESPAAATALASSAPEPTSDSSQRRARAEVRVQTVAGDPLTGVTVQAWSLPDRPDGASTRVAAATTGGEGFARIDDLAPGRFTFVARARGCALASAVDRRLDAAEAPHRIELLVEAGQALTGRVTDQDGRAVAGAVVVAEPPHPPWDRTRTALRVETVTDSEGLYAFDELSPGDTALCVALPGGVPVPTTTVLVPAVRAIDLSVRRGGSLCGHVTDAETGSPVPGADVYVQSSGAIDVLLGHAITDDDGRYAVDALLECVVRQVVAEKDGYASDDLADPRASRTAVFSLPRGASVTRDLVLRRGGSLSGRVTGPGGPVVGAKVVVAFGNRLGQWVLRAATAGEGGRFGVLHVAAGRAFVRVEAPGLKEAVLADPNVANSISLEPFAANVTEGGGAVFDVTMIADSAPAAPPPGRVRGVVVDEDGKPLPGAWVEVAPSNAGAAGPARERALVGADGAFDLAAALAPAKALRVRAYGPEFAETWSPPIELASLNNAVPLRLRLERGTSVAGELRRDDTGAPIPRAQVRISTPREDGGFARRSTGWSAPVVATTGADGRFVITNLRAGTYEVAFDAERSIGVVRTIDVPVRDAVAVDLAESREIAGRVAFADGSPLPGVRVAALPVTDGKTPRASGRVADATAAHDGSFVLRGLASGRYRLQVDAPSDRMLSFTQPPAEAVEAGTSDARVLVERALGIAGRILGADGRPARGVFVTLEAAGASIDPASTDADGAFAFQGLRAGTYCVSARTVVPDADVLIARQDGVAAGTHGVELVLGPALSIEGIVVDAEGHEVPGAAIGATPLDRAPDDESSGFHPLDAGGRFALHGLVPGRYEINVGNLRDRLRPLVIRGTRQFVAGSTGLRLEVHAARTVSGRLLDERGDPLAGRMIEFIPADAAWPSRVVRTSATGSFACDGLGPGPHRAELVSNEGESAERLPCGECEAGASGVEWRLP